MADHAVKHALYRIEMAARQLREEGYKPGYDVSLYRALREYHRVCRGDGSPGSDHDQRRLVRGLLFNGLAEHYSWTEVPNE